MRIDYVEIANFRKLKSIRVGLAEDKTVFVGANNSGKTSAMVALRRFLVDRERGKLSLDDFTLSNWPAIGAMGKAWEAARESGAELPAPVWEPVLPYLDVWLQVRDTEIHLVQKIIPNLDWEEGSLGVRLRLQPKDPKELQLEYLSARDDAKALQQAAGQAAEQQAVAEPRQELTTLWPVDLVEFLQRRLTKLFEVRAYILDPAKRQDPLHGRARPQPLPNEEPIDGDPFKGLIRIDEISAQRGFGQSDGTADTLDEEGGAVAATAGTRKLSEQLRRYYNRHLDPYEKPDAKDLKALRAIEDAQKAFDSRLAEGFSAAIKEMEALGYPGVTDPKLRISTRLKPVDGLNHEAAVQYVIRMAAGGAPLDLHLPEDSNGLGYQNLVSMVFRLMSFRDAWMKVGKAKTKQAQGQEPHLPPLHLVLIEEPEAHLHTQVQQVFIRQAYRILRGHEQLSTKVQYTTQMVVSTHSSHVAHESKFSALRYFRRLPANADEIPTSSVVNLSNVFGADAETERFVTRYLKVTHCDLFFADAAVLIEGPAERILLPHFIRNGTEFESLSECYITWLEIGGSHAHKMRPLIEHLGLTALIITDIDSVGADGKTKAPVRGAKMKSKNHTLKTWVPGTDDLDELLKKEPVDKVKQYPDEQFSMRIAYQHPIEVEFKGTKGEAIARTLEDAIVFENVDLFLGQLGGGLFKKIKEGMEGSADIPALSVAITDALKDGGKAEFALDLLELEDPSALKAPSYIREGFVWLAQIVRSRHEELGLAVVNISPPPAEQAA